MESSVSTCFYGWDEEIDLFAIDTNNTSIFLHYNKPESSSTLGANLLSWSEILNLLNTGNIELLLTKINDIELIGINELRPLEVENCILQLNRVKITVINSFDQFEAIRIILSYYAYILKLHNIKKVVIKNIPHLFIDYIFCIAARLLDINQEAWALLRGVSYQWSRVPLQEKFLFHVVDPLTGSVKKNEAAFINCNTQEQDSGYKMLFNHAKDLTQRFRSDSYGTDRYSGYIVHAQQIDRENLFATLHTETIANALSFMGKIKRQYKMSVEQNIQNELDRTKYIYLPLHKQPEMSSNPVAQDSWSQKLLILFWSKIASQLGMNLIVKEHPHMFKWSPQHVSHFLNEERFPRIGEDYKKLNQIRNVKFVDLHIDSNTIATGDNCSAVVTVEGTIGAVSSLAGKLTFVYGNPWYRFFDNVEIIRSTDDQNKLTANIKDNILNYTPRRYDEKSISEYCRWYSDNFLFCKGKAQLSKTLSSVRSK